MCDRLRCDFGQRFCTSCKRVQIDKRILMKLVFGCKQEDAGRHILHHENLTLAETIRILESDEKVREAKTERTEPRMSINLVSNRDRQNRQGRGNWQENTNWKFPENKCRKPKHTAQQTCPAQGSECRKCTKNEPQGKELKEQSATRLRSNTDDPGWQ